MFVSANILAGLTPSRRDDVEALYYTIIYILKGKLPWESNPNDKIRMSLIKLCNGLPSEFL
jgi:hypothetical protein